MAGEVELEASVAICEAVMAIEAFTVGLVVAFFIGDGGGKCEGSRDGSLGFIGLVCEAGDQVGDADDAGSLASSTLGFFNGDTEGKANAGLLDGLAVGLFDGLVELEVGFLVGSIDSFFVGPSDGFIDATA